MNTTRNIIMNTPQVNLKALFGNLRLLPASALGGVRDCKSGLDILPAISMMGTTSEGLDKCYGSHRNYAKPTFSPPWWRPTLVLPVNP
jgi:hypothetical protein